MIDICAIHVMSNLFNDLHFTTSLFCFLCEFSSVSYQPMTLNIQYVTIYSVPYFYNMYYIFFLNIGLINKYFTYFSYLVSSFSYFLSSFTACFDPKT